MTLPITLLTLSASLAMLFATFGRLTSMMSLFCSVPFGTIAYVAVWGGFNREGAALTLGLLLLLKLAAGTCLVLAHPRFLRSRGLVRLVLTSLLATVLITFLHGLVPRLLVSITDVLGALLVAVLGLVWALVLLVDALVSLLRGPRLERG